MIKIFCSRYAQKENAATYESCCINENRDKLSVAKIICAAV